jgi:tRNA1(Val) A37 N6-methylase TrmN6
MALMFQRLAHNFAKNGYYPTDSETLSRILSALSPCEEGEMRILDPCAGEGVALAECQQHLGKDRTLSYGIEYDQKRAWHAKDLLNCCIHGDMQHCVIGQKSVGLLFLNPPYGDLVSDEEVIGNFVQKGRKRLEKLFFQRTLPSLQWGGVLVLIIPRESLDEEFSHWISRNLAQVEIFTAPEQKFKQLVLFGLRAQSASITSPQTLKKRLMEIGKGEAAAEQLPTEWLSPYVVPAYSQKEMKFFISAIDAEQLATETSRYSCLWDQFQRRFNNGALPSRRPLMPLSQWHLALSLAAGQVSGIVESQDKRTFIIKGDTHKVVQESISYEEAPDGNFIEVKHQLDKFVPVIRAIDMTANSQTYGDVFTIR